MSKKNSDINRIEKKKNALIIKKKELMTLKISNIKKKKHVKQDKIWSRWEII